MRQTKDGRYNILTNRDNFSYADYVEYCHEMEIEPAPENSDEYFNWCYDETENNYNCDRDNIEYSSMNKGQFIITGSLGLWDGRHEIISNKTYDSLLDAIDACMPNCDFYIDVDWHNGVIEVSISHHDGINCFEIHQLSKKGEKAAESADYWMKDYDVKPYWCKKIAFAM